MQKMRTVALELFPKPQPLKFNWTASQQETAARWARKTYLDGQRLAGEAERIGERATELRKRSGLVLESIQK